MQVWVRTPHRSNAPCSDVSGPPGLLLAARGLLPPPWLTHTQFPFVRTQEGGADSRGTRESKDFKNITLSERVGDLYCQRQDESQYVLETLHALVMFNFSEMVPSS